jgi:hypothetical protein
MNARRQAMVQVGLLFAAILATSVSLVRFEGTESAFLGLWHVPAVGVFYFVLPVIIAIGYSYGLPWSRTAHIVKAGGVGYGLLSLVVPIAYGGISLLWPAFLFLLLCVVVDVATIADAEARSAVRSKAEPPNG